MRSSEISFAHEAFVRQATVILDINKKIEKARITPLMTQYIQELMVAREELKNRTKIYIDALSQRYKTDEDGKAVLRTQTKLESALRQGLLSAMKNYDSYYPQILDELKRGDRRAIEAAKNITGAEKKVLMNVLKTNQEEFEKIR